MVTSANVIIAQSVDNISITESNDRSDFMIAFGASSRKSLNDTALVSINVCGKSFEVLADDLWQVLFMCSSIAKAPTQLDYQPS